VGKRVFPREGIQGSYDPSGVEVKWYDVWMEKDVFRAHKRSDLPPYCIVIPPPNVTGSLHMGHALNNTLQDVVVRYKRMRGFDVLWLPGTDHAGIATQNVVEREIAKEGLTRDQLGRERFLQRVWEWKERYGSRIISQLKRLGASCDWSRTRFTLDEGLSRAVREVFVSLYREGLIYRGKYLVNWCPRCTTALSDLEVEHKEVKGKLYYVAYPVEGLEERVVVATTRPETILGDVAIAVHPEDERYRHLVGRTAVVPVVGRRIPIIEDKMVDPSFGTGCVKITPAHDPNDFLVGQRHGLPQIQVMDEKGVMTEEAGEFAGMDRSQCRKAFVERLEREGFLVKVEDHIHSVGHCYRCSSQIEPYLSDQWFVRTRPLAEPAVEAVRSGRIRFVPESWANTYYQWMENIRDWCISRQLWWGHRIPAWYCDSCGHVTVSSEDPTSCEACGSSSIRQDEDVLDTWFSSALWPFSTLGWPEETSDLRRFYPTDLLVTGFDIIFFWVARMIMMGLHFMGEIPFRDVYIHALVRDERGQKMSKSRGNVIDPLDMIEKYGADALRFTLCVLTFQGRDIMLSEAKIEGYKHFVNKLWNASRLVLMNYQSEGASLIEGPEDLVGMELKFQDEWILWRLDELVRKVTEDLELYRFGEAARAIYDFTWKELCDWYLEIAKPAMRGLEGSSRKAATGAVAFTVFETLLKLLHPFVPFVSEELWHRFGFGDELLAVSSWPRPIGVPERFEASCDKMRLLSEVVRSVRNLRADARIHPREEVRVYLRGEGEALGFLEEQRDYIALLSGAREVSAWEGEDRPDRSVFEVFPWGEVLVQMPLELDFRGLMGSLREELSRLEREMEPLRLKLLDENFLNRAPAEVVERERARLEEMSAVAERLRRNIEELG